MRMDLVIKIKRRFLVPLGTIPPGHQITLRRKIEVKTNLALALALFHHLNQRNHNL
uniref:Loosenin n=1 Tax=Phakopsora pachyrhizi TaxID=170000 RepID=A0A0S1MKC7_PHAPC